MLSTEIDTDALEPGERFHWWRDILANLIAPMDFTSPHTSNFYGRMHLMPLDDIYVFPVTMQTFACRRTPHMIRQSDPELYHLAFMAPGCNPIGVTQSNGQHITGPGSLYMVDTSLPYTVHATQPDTLSIGHCVEIPKHRLDLPRNTPVQQILGRSLPGTHGFASLLAHLLTHLARQPHTYRLQDAPYLARTVTDLITGLITQILGTGPPPDPDTTERTLLLAIKAFIERHLGDPDLKPAAIAVHHHISVRHLHRLFQVHGNTPASHIRRRRLDRAHRDLTDPAQTRTPVHAIARRWGFTSHAHFTRIYTRQFGIPPTHTRRALDQERRKP